MMARKIPEDENIEITDKEEERRNEKKRLSENHLKSFC
jgi:hypothetical protein